MEDAIAPVLMAIRGTLASDNWKAVVISETFEWQDHSALVLRLDLNNIGVFEAAQAGIFARLMEILKGAVSGSLLGYALEYRWQHILIIPALNGFALESVAWIIPCVLIAGKDDQGMPLSPWLRIPQPFLLREFSNLDWKSARLRQPSRSRR